MKVKVQLQAHLAQKYSPNGDGVFDFEVPDDATVTTLIDGLRIPDEDANVVIVQDQTVGASYKLSDGDHVTIIPPLAGG